MYKAPGMYCSARHGVLPVGLSHPMLERQCVWVAVGDDGAKVAMGLFDGDVDRLTQVLV